MMKLAAMISVLFFSTLATADCTVHIPSKTFDHDSGLSIRFDFNAVLDGKHYTEIDHSSEADFELRLEGIEKETQYFHHALAVFTLVQGETPIFKTEASITCMTQSCSIGDYGRAFRKAYAKLAKKIPVCTSTR